jgi:FMN-dependent oxidoreductase (nitrilotriacetate monooxygenase family)
MSANPFHMAWFVGGGFSVKDWKGTWAGTGGRDWATGELIVDLARNLERACFDFLLIEDSSNVPYTYGGSSEAYLKYAMSVMKNDPSPLVPLIAAQTKKIGVAPTLSTTEYPPFLLARLLNTLDHVSGGRAGWNIVTGSNDGGAQNYGMDRQFDHDLRYEMAEEYWDLCCALWDSWEPDAVVMDRERNIWADHTKVHVLDFVGKYFRCRGPLNSPRSPQGRPTFVQAGSSGPGKKFGARVSNVVISNVNGIEKMKAFREEVHAEMDAIGRPHSECKVLFLSSPVLGETTEEAIERRERERAYDQANIEPYVSEMSRGSGKDFSTYDWDEPLGEFTSNGHRSHSAAMVGRTVRQIAHDMIKTGMGSIPLVGTPDDVAAEMGEVMEEVGGDGFLVTRRYFNRRYVAEIADGLVPALQRRGLMRTELPYDTFRENVLAF